MPAKELSRLVDERHPIAGWLYRAAGLPLNGALVMSFANSHDAKRAASALAGWRRKGKLGAPGSFEETARDPRGEGLGFFDRIVVQQVGAEVRLKHLPDGFSSLRSREITPLGTYTVLDPDGLEPPETCSRVNPEDFDVVTG